MGFISNFINKNSKNKSIIIVNNLLSHQSRVNRLDINTQSISNVLVNDAWTSFPDVFNRQDSITFNKVTIAAISLSLGLVKHKNDKDIRSIILISLGMLLSELETNGSRYNINSLEVELIQLATTSYIQHANEFFDSHKSNDNQIKSETKNNISWDEWFCIFKNESSSRNSQLAMNENGDSLIDFLKMDNFKVAHENGDDPVEFAINFSEKFNIDEVINNTKNSLP